MALSEDVARAIANNFRVEFSKRVDVEKEWPVWQHALDEAGLNDENAEAAYVAFARSWTKISFPPSLHNFCNWMRTNIGRPAPKVSRGSLERTAEQIALNKRYWGRIRSHFGRLTGPTEHIEDVEDEAREIIEDVPDDTIPF